MQANELQVSFFRYLKDQLPDHISLVYEVSELLNISNDSAYRRIRGEKPITFDEIELLAKHYKVSLDRFLHLQTKAVLFRGNYINRDNFEFENYLKGIVEQLSVFLEAKEKEMFYMNKDIPIFHHFMFPELAAFKCYFWCRYNLNTPKYNKGQFLISDFMDSFNSTGKKISEMYLQIPSTEIWNLDCINTTIRQIDYYRESKIFKSDEDIKTVYNCLEKLVDHIEQQAEAGYKFPYRRPNENKKVKYSIFINEFVLGDNTVIAHIDDKKIVFVIHSIINYISTMDEEFVGYLSDTLHILLKKSTLISEVGEKDRELFFDQLRYRIHEKKRLV